MKSNNPDEKSWNNNMYHHTLTHTQIYNSGLYRRVLYKGFPYKLREGFHISLESNTCFTNTRLRLTNS